MLGLTGLGAVVIAAAIVVTPLTYGATIVFIARKTSCSAIEAAKALSIARFPRLKGLRRATNGKRSVEDKGKSGSSVAN